MALPQITDPGVTVQRTSDGYSISRTPATAASPAPPVQRTAEPDVEVEQVVSDAMLEDLIERLEHRIFNEIERRGGRYKEMF